MPIIETLKPRDPEQLQTKIFATATGEDDVILIAVQEHVCSHPAFPPLPQYLNANPALHHPCQKYR
jgi:hypothetical protein